MKRKTIDEAKVMGGAKRQYEKRMNKIRDNEKRNKKLKKNEQM